MPRSTMAFNRPPSNWSLAHPTEYCSAAGAWWVAAVNASTAPKSHGPRVVRPTGEGLPGGGNGGGGGGGGGAPPRRAGRPGGGGDLVGAARDQWWGQRETEDDSTGRGGVPAPPATTGLGDVA